MDQRGLCMQEEVGARTEGLIERVETLYQERKEGISLGKHE